MFHHGTALLYAFCWCKSYLLYHREMLKGLFSQQVSLGATSWIVVCCIGKIFFEGWSLNGLFSWRMWRTIPSTWSWCFLELFGALLGFYLTILVGYLAINILFMWIIKSTGLLEQKRMGSLSRIWVNCFYDLHLYHVWRMPVQKTSTSLPSRTSNTFFFRM